MRNPTVFWSKVNKDGPVFVGTGTRCWVWTGRLMKNGYGMNKPLMAHRQSWAEENGPIPKGLCVLHKCDRPACVNPNHLFLGTQQDNLADMRAKGRQVRGEQQGSSVLTEDQVRRIRERYKRYSHKDGCGAIARDLGVSLIAVWRVVNDLTWRHVS